MKNWYRYSLVLLLIATTLAAQSFLSMDLRDMQKAVATLEVQSPARAHIQAMLHQARVIADESGTTMKPFPVSEIRARLNLVAADIATLNHTSLSPADAATLKTLSTQVTKTLGLLPK